VRGHRFKEIWVSRSSVSGPVKELLEEAIGLGIKIRSCEREQLENKAGKVRHQGILAFLAPYTYATLEDILTAARQQDPAFILLLDGIQDPQNLGALIRSAHLCGVHGVIIPKHRAGGLTAGVHKASAGALEHVPVARVTNLAATIGVLKQQAIWVVGLAMEGEQLLFEVDFTQPTALVIGSEAAGIRPLVKRSCDLLAAIPQLGELNSFSASAAGAMAMYEVMRQRFKFSGQREQCPPAPE